MEETLYSAKSELIYPGRFIRSISSDLRVSPSVAWSLFLRNLRVQYRQTWLGYFWLLLPPLATTLVWVFLSFANILKVGQTDAPYPIYVLTGTLLWQVFTEALHSPLHQLSSARELLTRSKIPHEALLLSGLIEVIFNFGIRLLVLLPVFIWFQTQLNPSLLLVPVGVLTLLLLGFGLGLLLTPLGLLYQDVSRGLTMVVGFWFFLTPIIYPPPETWTIRLLDIINPVTPLLLTTRDWFIGGTIAVAPRFTLVAGLSLFAVGIAWLQYRLARPHLLARL